TPNKTEQRSQEYRLGRTIHRQCDTADETPGPLPKAHRTVVGSAVRALFPPASDLSLRCGAQAMPRHSMLPNLPVPFRGQASAKQETRKAGKIDPEAHAPRLQMAARIGLTAICEQKLCADWLPQPAALCFTK